MPFALGCGLRFRAEPERRQNGEHAVITQIAVLALFVLPVAIAARYAFHLGGAWRRIYVIGAAVALTSTSSFWSFGRAGRILNKRGQAAGLTRGPAVPKLLSRCVVWQIVLLSIRGLGSGGLVERPFRKT